MRQWAIQHPKIEPRILLQLEGEAELVDQEGGYAHPSLEVDGTSVTNELSELLDPSRVGRYRLRVTVELIEDRGPIKCERCDRQAAKFHDLCSGCLGRDAQDWMDATSVKSEPGRRIS